VTDRSGSFSDIAKSPVFHASVETLTERWLDRDRSLELLGDEKPDARVIAGRLVVRAESVRRYVDLPQASILDTPRKWDTGWNAQKTWDRVAAALERLGWQSRLIDVKRLPPPLLAEQENEGRDVVLVEKWAAEDRAREFRQAGLLLPFTWREGAAYLLCDALYDIAADKMGNPPAREYVDLLARHVFCQQVRGWPFLPWVIDFIN
jgi:hypothetical protein